MELIENNGEPYHMAIREYCMTELLINEQPCIKYIAQIGIDNHYHFVCKNDHESQVRRLLDEYCDSLNDYFTMPEEVRTKTNCDESPWWSGRMHRSHGINNYINSLNLPSDGTNIFVSIVNEPNH